MLTLTVSFSPNIIRIKHSELFLFYREGKGERGRIGVCDGLGGQVVFHHGCSLKSLDKLFCNTDSRVYADELE